MYIPRVESRILEPLVQQCWVRLCQEKRDGLFPKGDRIKSIIQRRMTDGGYGIRDMSRRRVYYAAIKQKLEERMDAEVRIEAAPSLF